MARSKRGNRSCNVNPGNTLNRGGYKQEPSQRPAPTAGTSGSRNREYLYEHKTTSDKHNNSGSTLADIARKTSVHDHSSWSERSQLRNKPVQFISRGPSNLLESNFPIEPNVDFLNALTAGSADQGETHAKAGFKSQNLPALNHTTGNSDKPSYMNILSSPTGPIADHNTCTENLFIIDTVGEKTTSKGRRTPPVKIPQRHSSPDSSSADEVILFQGRKSHGRVMSITGMSHKLSLPRVTSTTFQYPSDDATCSLVNTSQPLMSKEESSPLEKKEQNCVSLDNEEDVLLDYICNIRENDELGNIYRQSQNIGHAVSGSDEDHFLGSSQSDDETHDVSYVSNQDGCQLSSENGSMSDLRFTDRHKANENDDIDNSSDDQDSLAASVSNPMLGPSSAVSMHSSTEPCAWSMKRMSHTLSQEQVDFDFMDWNRPSVQRVKKSKGARADYVPFDNCDSDLERQLQVAWNNDRQRKKERKQQREERRALGMLQKRAARDDLRLKYPFGMTITQVADELREYLEQKKEIIIFPPMDLHARKTVHELANTFNIKSKSVGKAEQRRPSLYRTTRTVSYSEATFDRAVRQVRRKFLPRADKKGKSKPLSKKQNRSSASKTAANYQEGEIVGAAAPELGIGNRGRAMLEKMGWSLGTALGAEDNKGILQPVSLAMKRSKAGLG
ncbi:hypothetical protein E4U53_000370 [Claviceps sorghi]|nr:hypothetical protein E4U53_000370 [Claviceps sorghi]